MSGQVLKDHIRQGFLDAATSLLRTSPPGGISARKIAAEAGYSYATIYNYFPDLNGLLWHALLRFIQELQAHVQEFLDRDELDREDFMRIWMTYGKFFLETPGVFILFYMTDLGDPPEELGPLSDEPELAIAALSRLRFPGFSLTGQALLPAARLLATSVQGIIAMKLSGKTGWTFEQTLERIEATVTYFLERHHE